MCHRWLYHELSTEIISCDIFGDWSNVEHLATMHRTIKIEKKWPQRFYSLCPFFIDYPQGQYPMDESAQYIEATHILETPLIVDKPTTEVCCLLAISMRDIELVA